jgi:hypothetical protein
LLAAPAVSAQQFVGYTPDVKACVASFAVESGFDLIAEGPDFTREGIAVDLTQISPAVIDVGGLQRLPPAFDPVISQIGGDGVRVQLRIELAAGVVVINSQREIAGGPVIIGAVLPHPGSRMGFEFGERLLNRFLMGTGQPFIAPDF